MLTTGLMLYNHDADGAANPAAKPGTLPDDSGLVKSLETGVNAPGASPGEGMLAVGLIPSHWLGEQIRQSHRVRREAAVKRQAENDPPGSVGGSFFGSRGEEPTLAVLAERWI